MPNVGWSPMRICFGSSLTPLGFVAVVTVVRCTPESRALYRLLNSCPCGGRSEGDRSPSVFFLAGEYGYAGVTTFLWDRTCQLFVLFVLRDVSMSDPWVHIWSRFKHCGSRFATSSVLSSFVFFSCAFSRSNVVRHLSRTTRMRRACLYVILLLRNHVLWVPFVGWISLF